jgi:transposase
MIPRGTKVYFALQPTDMRRTYDGLATVARSVLKREPAAGGLFVFLNRRGDQVRVLFKDPHGWCLLCKRLDRGSFRRPRCNDDGFVWETEADALVRFLDDVDLGRSIARMRQTLAPHLSIVPQPAT